MENLIFFLIGAGALAGGLDVVLNNKMGLGKSFTQGIQALGPLTLGMTGIICLSPLIAGALRPIFYLYQVAFHLDPAILCSVLACDMGGYTLAREIAHDVQMGSYAGMIIASMLGCTLSFLIPVGLNLVGKENLPLFFKGDYVWNNWNFWGSYGWRIAGWLSFQDGFSKYHASTVYIRNAGYRTGELSGYGNFGVPYIWQRYLCMQYRWSIIGGFPDDYRKDDSCWHGTRRRNNDYYRKNRSFFDGRIAYYGNYQPIVQKSGRAYGTDRISGRTNSLSFCFGQSTSNSDEICKFV